MACIHSKLEVADRKILALSECMGAEGRMNSELIGTYVISYAIAMESLSLIS